MAIPRLRETPDAEPTGTTSQPSSRHTWLTMAVAKKTDTDKDTKSKRQLRLTHKQVLIR